MYVKTFHMWSIGFLDLKNIENRHQYHSYQMSFSRFIVNNAFWWRNCNQSIAVRVVIVCFRLSDFLLIHSRTPAEQTSSTDNVHNIALLWSYFTCVLSDVISTVGLHCCCPVDRFSSLSISESVQSTCCYTFRVICILGWQWNMVRLRYKNGEQCSIYQQLVTHCSGDSCFQST